MLDSESSDQLNEKVQKAKQDLNSLTKEIEIVKNSLQIKPSAAINTTLSESNQRFSQIHQSLIRLESSQDSRFQEIIQKFKLLEKFHNELRSVQQELVVNSKILEPEIVEYKEKFSLKHHNQGNNKSNAQLISLTQRIESLKKK